MSKPRRQKVRVCASRETLRNIVQDKILRKRERLTLSEAADLKMIKISVLLRWLPLHHKIPQHTALSNGVDWSSFLYDDDVKNPQRRGSFRSADDDDEIIRKMSWEGFDDDDDNPLHLDNTTLYADEEDMNLFQSLASTTSLENTAENSHTEKEEEKINKTLPYDKERRARAVERYLEKRQRRVWKTTTRKSKTTKQKSKVKPVTSPIAKQVVSSPADQLDAEEREKFEVWKKQFLREQKKQQRKLMNEIRRKKKEKQRLSRRLINRPLVKLVCASSPIDEVHEKEKDSCL